jgi:2-amino-4-hydroxy-6-hydroxymethyldihydropteridine diphosphokinase
VSPLAAISLGANLPSKAGSPEQTLLAAIDELAGAGRVEARSSLYRTEPVGIADQPAFVNAAVTLTTTLAPEALLDFLLSIERRYGRDRQNDPPRGPRTLDLDLLLFDDLVVHLSNLTLPHPGLAERRFVLAPLAEIAPDLRDPLLGRTVAELLANLPDTGANRIEAVRKIYSAQARD